MSDVYQFSYIEIYEILSDIFSDRWSTQVIRDIRSARRRSYSMSEAVKYGISRSSVSPLESVLSRYLFHLPLESLPLHMDNPSRMVQGIIRHRLRLGK